MPTKKPLFSIITPTYDRAHLLPFAVKSVLAQTFTDFELIISNGGSTDNTREVVASFDDSRIRYVESQKRLSIGDNYQQGYDQARGEYITFLSDDDAFVPHMLDRVSGIIANESVEILVFRSCFYFPIATDFFGRNVDGNSLYVDPYSEAITRFDREEAARSVFGNFNIGAALNHDFNVSYLANAVCHNSVLAKVRRQTPKLFEMTPADGFLAAAVTFVVDTYHSLNEPLHVWTGWSDNATASAAQKKNNLRLHYEQLLNGKTLDHVPLKFALPLNCTYNALFAAKSTFDTDGIVNIDWADYYFRIHENLGHLRGLGINIKKELAEWRDKLGSEPSHLQSDVERRSGALAYILKGQFRSKTPTFFRIARWMLSYRNKLETSIFDGRENGFENVLECAAFHGANLNKTVLSTN